MAAKPTIAEIRGEHIETDIHDDALQRLIDAAEREVIDRFGEHTTQTDDLEGGAGYLFPMRPVGSVTSITESIGNTDVVLAANDYVLRNGGKMIERRSDGTNGRTSWADRVRVVYVPVTEDARRKEVMIDLVRHALTSVPGQTSQSDGDHSFNSQDYQEAREKILSRLYAGRRSFA